MSAIKLSFANTEIDIQVRSFRIEEGLSQPFEVSLVGESGLVFYDPEEIVGRVASLRFGTVQQPGVYRAWGGAVTHFDSVETKKTDGYKYFIRIVPDFWRTKLRTNCRIFQHRSVPDIVCQVLGEYDIVPVLEMDPTSYPTFEYRVQYNETDFGFISRLLEEAGISYTFRRPQGSEEDEDELSTKESKTKKDGGMAVVTDDHRSVMVLTDRPTEGDLRAFGPLPYWGGEGQPPSQGVAVMTNMKMQTRMRAGRLTLCDFDFERHLDLQLIAQAKAEIAREERYERYLYEPGSFHVEGAEGGAASFKEGASHAERWLEAERRERRRIRYVSTALDIEPGKRFYVVDHPRDELNEPTAFMVVRQTLVGTPTSPLSVEGVAAFAEDPYRPHRVTPRPKVSGIQSALVVGPKGEEIHTDEHGRVCVQFHWDREGNRDEKSSRWIRVSQAWAGRGYGFIALPRIGEEVLVDFLEGDPEQPVIVGRVYNATAKPPNRLPDFKTRTTLRSESTPGSGGANELSFEDKKGGELFIVSAQRDLEETVKNDVRMNVGNSVTTNIQRDEVHTVGGTQLLSVQGDRAVSVEGNHSMSVTGNYAMKSGNQTGAAMGADGTLVLTNGQASIVLKGPNIYFDAAQNIRMSSGQITSINGGEVHIDGKPNIFLNCAKAAQAVPTTLDPAQAIPKLSMSFEEQKFLDNLGELPDSLELPGSINEQLEDMAKEVENQAQSKIEQLKTKAEMIRDKLKAKAQMIKQKAEELYEDLRARVEAVKQEILGRLEALKQRAEAILEQAKARLEALKARVMAAKEKVLGAIESVKARIKAAYEQIKAKVQGIIDRILATKDAIIARFDAFKQQVAAVRKALVDGVLKQIQAMREDALAIVEDIKNAVKGVADEAKAIVEQVKQEIEAMKDAFENIKGAVEETKEAVGDAVDAVKGLFGGGAAAGAGAAGAGASTNKSGDGKGLDVGGGDRDVPAGEGLADAADPRAKGGSSSIEVGDAAARSGEGGNFLEDAQGAGRGAGGSAPQAGVPKSGGANDALARANGRGSDIQQDALARKGGSGDFLEEARGAGEGANGDGNGRGTSLAPFESSELATDDRGDFAPGESPLSDTTVMSRSGGFGGEETANTINSSRGPTILQSPSEGQMMVVRGPKAQPIDQSALQQRVVDSQMEGTSMKDALGDNLTESGYTVYERPWGDYNSSFVKRAPAA